MEVEIENEKSKKAEEKINAEVIRIGKLRKIRTENRKRRDLGFLDSIQIEMSTARQFLFSLRIKDRKEGQIFQQINRSSKLIAEHGFDVRQLKKEDIKRMLAIYFEVSMNGEEIELIEGEKYLEAAVNEKN